MLRISPLSKALTAMSESIKSNIISWLRIIASYEEQLIFERKAAGEMAGDEIVENWFSSYFPDDPVCKNMFTSKERNILNQFHHEFEQCASSLPTKLAELHQTEEWKNIVLCAQKVLVRCAF